MDNSKKLKFNIFEIPIVYIVSSIIVEIGTFIFLSFGVFPKYFVLELCTLLILSSLIFITSNKIIQLILSIIFLIAQMALSYINITLYSIYGDLFSFDMIVLGAEAFSVFDPSFLKWGFISFLFIVLIISITLMCLSFKHKIRYKFKSKPTLYIIAIFFLVQALSFSGYFLSIRLLKNDNNESLYTQYFIDDKILYDKQLIKSECLQRFGTIPFYTKNLNNILFDSSDYSDISSVTEYIKSGQLSNNDNYTGILKDDNLICIMCESLEWYAINPVLTPTLYKIFNTGCTLNNYYSKSKTNYSEMDVILGSVPTDNAFTNSFHKSNSSLLGNKLSFSLPNKFKNNGYDSIKFFHDNLGDFYARKTTHYTFGFDDVITLEDMDIEDKADGRIGRNSNYTKDSDMFESCKELIAPLDKHFFTFITTITSHGPFGESDKLGDYYDILDSGKLNEYIKWLEGVDDFYYPTDTKFQNYLRYYLATIMDLDKGISILLDYLETNGMRNNTTIVMYSDHNAYYHDLAYEMRNIKKGDYKGSKLYRVPAVIYSTKLGNMDINKFMCPYNIAPTIFDLFGIKYNTNLYMGYSLFSDSYDKTIFVSQLGGMMTTDIYSDNNIDFYFEDEKNEKEIEKFKNNATLFYYKQINMNKVYNTNIFETNPELENYV